MHPWFTEMEDDKTIEGRSSYSAFYDHESKDFKYVQLKGNVWQVVAVTGGSVGKYSILCLPLFYFMHFE
jgi:succinyl-CoA synthetase beta subunit